jgi:hypothetical protein
MYTFLNKRLPGVSKNNINGGNRAILYKLILAGDFEQRAKGLVSTKKEEKSRKVRQHGGL